MHKKHASKTLNKFRESERERKEGAKEEKPRAELKI